MYGFNNYNAYTSYLTPQSNGYSPSNYIQNQLGLPSAQQMMQQSQMMQQQQQMMQQPQPMMQQPMAPPPQQFFAQPSGQLFSINNADELQTIPVQEGAISAVINPNENMLYLKTLQGGRPVVLDYQLKSASIASQAVQPEPVVEKPEEVEPVIEETPSDPVEVESLKKQIVDLNETINKMSARIDELEKTTTTKKQVNTKKIGEE